MRLFDEAHSYATKENAERKLRRVFGDNLDQVKWFIAVNSNGMYVPVVTEFVRTNLHNIASQNVVVFGT
jgi:hypothetical protein